MKRAIAAIAVVVAAGWACQGRTITVDDDGAGDFSTIQAAIDDSNDGDTVLVADGTYTGDGNRDIDFHGKAITVKSENGPETCIIDCNGTEAEPHRGVHFQSGEDANSAIIGITITNGYPPVECLTRPPWPCFHFGGGIRCKASSPTISHCRITGNWAEYGGGIHSDHGSPIVTDCTISGNYARAWGGGMGVESSNPIISDCMFSRNLAWNEGGGMAVYNGSPVITNCTVVGNSSEYQEGGGISRSGGEGNLVLTNCILWDNTDVGGTGETAQVGGVSDGINYCSIQGWTGTLGGQGNIGDDPCFADPWNGDYHLKSQAGRYDTNEEGWTTDDVTSPCVDAGDPMSPIGPEPFPNGGIINMGAYAGTTQASKSWFGGPPCEVIVTGDVNGDCRVDFSDFAILASHWLECTAPECNQRPEVYITRPPDGFEFYWLLESVWIEADAWDVDGSVVEVEFIIESITEGWRYKKIDNDGSDGWKMVTSFDIGTYLVTAKATDNEGATTTSPPVTITAGEGPDLTVSESDIIFSHLHPVVGEEITISVTVHNIGDVDAGEFVVYLAASCSSDGVIWTIPAPLDWITVPHLSAGSSTTISINGSFPWGITCAISVEVDCEQQIDESDETNNYAGNTLEHW